MSAREALYKFKGVKLNDGDGWTALCPAHDDERNSLRIGDGDNGRILLRCNAGCTFEAVCLAAGINLRDREESLEPSDTFAPGVGQGITALNVSTLQPDDDASVSEWVDAGFPRDEVLALVQPSSEKTEDAALQIVRMADVAPEAVRWLWFPYIPLGKLTILEGDPGLGKSWLTCALASAVSNGRGLPGTDSFEPGNVLMLSAEDGLGDTLRPRLDSVRADLQKVFALSEPLTLDVPGLLRLEASIIDYKPLLVIIDPLFAYTGGKVDIHRANECRAISAPLAAMAERQGCAVLALRHLTKAIGRTAMSAGMGSVDFRAAARSVLLVGADPDDSTQRAIIQTKNNLALEGNAIGYRIDDGQFWWTGESTLTAGRILSVPSDEESRGEQTEAVDFLRETLSAGPRAAKEIKAEARQAGLTEQMLRTARLKLGVLVRKQGQPGSDIQRWTWALPEDVAEDAEGVSKES